MIPLIIVIAAALVANAIPAPALAFENMLPLYETAKPKVERVSNAYKSKPKRKAKPKAKVVRKAAPKPETTRVLAAEYRTDDIVRCLAPVRVVGSQDVRESAAEDSARKAWSEQVRWAHGEAFMDMTNSKEYQRRCSRSSIGEIAGQVFHRCEIIASPCRPGMVKGGVE